MSDDHTLADALDDIEFYARGVAWQRAIPVDIRPPFGFPIIRLSAERYRRWLLPERRTWWVRLRRRVLFLVVAYSPSLEVADGAKSFLDGFIQGMGDHRRGQTKAPAE